jgi:hypothetical protein
MKFLGTLSMVQSLWSVFTEIIVKYKKTASVV